MALSAVLRQRHSGPDAARAEHASCQPPSDACYTAHAGEVPTPLSTTALSILCCAQTARSLRLAASGRQRPTAGPP